jgi:hypothetical protein
MVNLDLTFSEGELLVMMSFIKTLGIDISKENEDKIIEKFVKKPDRLSYEDYGKIYMISPKHQIYFQIFDYDLRFYKKKDEDRKEFILGICTYPNDPKQLVKLISDFEER